MYVLFLLSFFVCLGSSDHTPHSFFPLLSYFSGPTGCILISAHLPHSIATPDAATWLEPIKANEVGESKKKTNSSISTRRIENHGRTSEQLAFQQQRQRQHE